MPHPTVDFRNTIEQIVLKNNESITVYLPIKRKEKFYNIQIEIRIIDNIPQIFCDELETIIFKKWTSDLL